MSFAAKTHYKFYIPIAKTVRRQIEIIIKKDYITFLEKLPADAKIYLALDY
jgi:hypothetical protein